jgi:hypothetical protein
MDQAGLRGSVGRHLRRDAQPEDRGDVDDRAALPVLFHVARDRLRDPPRPGQVHVDHAAPVLVRPVERRLCDRDAGVVHEDRDGPERIARLRDRARDARRIGNVERDDRRLAAFAADRLGELLAFGQPTSGQRHFRPGARERHREVPAEVAERAGHEGGLALEGRRHGR